MSKFPIWRSRNFQFELKIFSWNVEISSLNSTWNFDFGKLEISTSQLEISSSNSKFRLRQMVNEPIRWNNYITNQQLEISTSSNWKFRVQSGNFDFQTGNFDFQTGNFDFQTGNFDFGKLEISTSQLEISSSNSKFTIPWHDRPNSQYMYIACTLHNNSRLFITFLISTDKYMYMYRSAKYMSLCDISC